MKCSMKCSTKCSMKCSTEANDEHTMKVININFVRMMEETVNS